MRILHVTGGLHIGGSQMIVAALARGCATAGHEVTVWNLGQTGPYEDELVEAGVQVVSLLREGRLRPASLLVAASMVVRMALGRWRVVHSHLSISAAVSVASALNPRVCWVTSYHGQLTTAWRRRLARVLSVLQTGTVAVSSGVRSYLVEYCGVSYRRITVIHNGIPPLAGSPPAESSGRDGTVRRTTLGCVGRVAPHKGQVLLAEAFADLGRHDDVRLVFIGDGPDRKRLEDVTAPLRGSGAVSILGQRRDAVELIAGFGLLVVPSSFEGFSLAALEAMRAGVAVVATDTGGTPEVVVDGHTGWLFRSGERDALAAALERALESDLVAAGAAGRERYLRLFTEEQMLIGHLSYYQRLSGART
jgi:glycosyltransferase involved in cell wall biosynthesis